MTTAEFISKARSEAWSRKQTRSELFKLNRPDLWEQRDTILAALGMAPTATQAEVEAKAAAARAAVDAEHAARAASEREAAAMESERQDKAAQQAAAEAQERHAALKAAIADGATIFCDAAANKVDRVVNAYGKKMSFDNGGCRVGVVVDTPAGRFEARHVNTKCYAASGAYDGFAAECWAVLKAVELAIECHLKTCVIANDRIGGFAASTKRGYIGAKYLWVAQKLAAEAGLSVTFDRVAGEENEADAASRSED